MEAKKQNKTKKMKTNKHWTPEQSMLLLLKTVMKIMLDIFFLIQVKRCLSTAQIMWTE